MNLTVNREGKYAIVWMTNAEKADPKVMENTKDLLIHNRGLEKTDDTPKVMGLG